jgi:hypothetical protein
MTLREMASSWNTSQQKAKMDDDANGMIRTTKKMIFDIEFKHLLVIRLVLCYGHVLNYTSCVPRTPEMKEEKECF